MNNQLNIEKFKSGLTYHLDKPKIKDSKEPKSSTIAKKTQIA